MQEPTSSKDCSDTVAVVPPVECFKTGVVPKMSRKKKKPFNGGLTSINILPRSMRLIAWTHTHTRTALHKYKAG